MHRFIKDFFTWSKKERIGVIVLSVLLLSIFIFNVFFDRWFIPKLDGWAADSLKYYSHMLESLEKDGKNNDSINFKTSIQSQKKLPGISEIKYFPFDPNKIKLKDWMLLGFSEKQAIIILKYKNSISGFKSKEDLGKCFIIDQNKMMELNPYIRIDTSFLVENKTNTFQTTSSDSFIKNIKIKIPVIVELNSADSIQLITIKGIGPYFANKILTYRKNLGGYKNKEQLLEIWNFDSTRLAQINNQIIIDTALIDEININQADIDTLKSHPYIRWSLANAIVKYREQHGNYKTLADVKNVALMTDSIFNKLSPYLVTE